jgi:hypothetical protein
VTRGAHTALLVFALCALGDRSASAQTAGPDAGRLELSAGGAWLAAQSIGSATANETTSTRGTLALFSTTSTLAGAPMAEGRIGWRAWRAWTAEAEASYGKPELRIAVSGDAEGAAPLTAVERIQQFTIGGAIVWHFPFRASRAVPFLTAGGGYLRQLHENATLAQTGRYYQVGGGLTVPFASRPRSRLSAIGLRIDVRAMVFVDGVALDGAAHVAPAAGASFFVRLR